MVPKGENFTLGPKRSGLSHSELCSTMFTPVKRIEKTSSNRHWEAGRRVPTLTGLSRALYVFQLAAENR